MLKSNQDLQPSYSIKPYNSFSDITDTIDCKYQHFITANKENAKEMIPKKAKQKNSEYSDDERVQNKQEVTLYCILMLHHKSYG